MKRRAAAVAAMAVLTAMGGWVPASAEVKPGEEQGLGLVGPEIPNVLERAKADPYGLPPGDPCETAPQELALLDQALGPDADEPKKKKKGIPVIGTVVKSVIPYRGVVRLLTGASKKEKELTDAAMAGSARRGYLRGVVANCAAKEDAAVHDALNSAVVPGDKAPATSAYTAPVAAAASETAQPATEPAPKVIHRSRTVVVGASQSGGDSPQP